MNTETLRVAVLAKQERLDRQPLWVRELVNDLMAELNRRDKTIAELTEAPTGTTTFADPYGTPMPIGRNPHIRHDMPGSGTGAPNSFVVEFADDRIEVRGDGLGRRLSIEPTASNVVELRWRNE